MSNSWKSGDIVILREIFQSKISSAFPVIMIKDSPEEIALALVPGAEGFVTEDYSKGKQNGKRRWDFKDKPWKLENHIWHTNRVLILIEPQKYYAINYFWDDKTNEFSCYYVNFQLPFQRSHCGIDTLDLEIDLVIDSDFSYRWKDLDDYQKSIDSGIITNEWAQEIENAKQEVFEKLSKRQYPFDESWLNWKLDPCWPAPKLPENWDKV